jgi:hypothetical protein
MTTTGKPRQLEFGVMRRQEPAATINQELVEALADLLLQAAGGVPVQEESDESEDLG